VPRLAEGAGGNPFMKDMTDYWVEDASYLRIKNVQLGYTLPQDVSSRFGVSRLRVYVSAENLWTFTKYSGYDPEQGRFIDDDPLTQGIDEATYPSGRKYLMGLNLTF
jgi:hypothetical protein